MIGKTISHYRIEEKLGEGGMGVVYKARDLALDRLVALKVLPTDKLGSAERRRRFVQEAKAASALNHPNIVTIHEIGRADGTDFIVMEYVAGQTLDGIIPRRGLPLQQALKYAVQIADAMVAAHKAGIIHRDLKPSNIIDGDDGRVRVLDFGLAKLTAPFDGRELSQTQSIGYAASEFKARTKEGAILGTVSYMSPEQAEGLKVDHRSDIFSFGSVLYEMVSGRRAFRGDSNVSGLAAILRDEPEPVSSIVSDAPRDLEKIIARCLRKAPERRFQHMDDLTVALEELIEQSESGTLTRTPALWRGGARLKSWRAAAILGVVAAIAAAAIGWHLMRKELHPPAPLHIVPLTSLPGHESEPAMSPDANQVAFIWNGEGLDNYDLYIKLIGGGPPLRLTTDPGPERCPAWAPDGSQLAYLRPTPTGADLLVIPALGGPERKLTDLSLRSHKISWSPNGQFLAAEDRGSGGEPDGIFLISVLTGEKRRLTTPSAAHFSDRWPAFSPDGRTLAFGRGGTNFSVFVLPLPPDGEPEGEPRRLTGKAFYMEGLDWTPDGQALVFGATIDGGRWRLWKIPAGAKAGGPEPLQVEGEHAQQPTVARQRFGSEGRLAYTSYSSDSNIYRIPGPGGRGAEPTAQLPAPRRIVSSSRYDATPRFSPGGDRIVFVSDRSGSTELWVANNDGSNPMRLTSFGGPFVATPRWSPDSQRIVFDASEDHTDIYVVNADGGVPQRLTTDNSNETRPSWSRDGRWIYYASDRNGPPEIERMPAEGGSSEQITRNRGIEALESPDGRWVYYAKYTAGRGDTGIWRIPVNGGEEELVLDEGVVGRWALSQSGIYLLNPGGPGQVPAIELFRFDARERTVVAEFPGEARFETAHSLAVSDDDRWIAYTQRDQTEADIMLVADFR